MDLKRVVTPDTKVDKNATAIRTNLTLDFKDVSQEHILEYAIDALVVKWQAKVRAAKHIPANDTYIVPVPGTRAQADPLATLAAKDLTADEIKRLEAILAAKKTIIVRKQGA